MNLKLINLDIATAAYNEEGSIDKFINNFILIHDLYSDRLNLNLFITNDGSCDRTKEIIESNSNLKNYIKLFNLTKNMGAGFAINNSCSKSTGDFILLIDSDNQYDLNTIIKSFLEIHSETVSIYFGQRDLKILNFGPYLTSLIYKKIFPFKNRIITDYSCVVKIVRKNLLKDIKLEAKRMNYSNELTVRLLNTDHLFQTFQVCQQKRDRGISKTRFFLDATNRLIFSVYLRIQISLLKKGIIFE